MLKEVLCRGENSLLSSWSFVTRQEGPSTQVCDRARGEGGKEEKRRGEGADPAAVTRHVRGGLWGTACGALSTREGQTPMHTQAGGGLCYGGWAGPEEK